MNAEDKTPFNPDLTPNPSEASQSTPPDEQTQSIERLTAEVADLKDKYMRAVAEMDNMRRRMERERSDLVKFALEDAFKDFLSVLDSFDRALPDDADHAQAAAAGSEAQVDSGTAFREGMTMVKRQLLDTFRKHGLEPIKSAGEDFDPNLHQAIQRVESAEVQTEVVGDVFARGYLLNGRLLRPAMVSVLVPSN